MEPTTDIKVADQKGRLTLGARFAGKRFAFREEADGTAVLTPVVVVPLAHQPLTRQTLDRQLDGLTALGADWDGQGSLPPSAAVLDHARDALAVLHAGALSRGIIWTDPHVGCNERGQVTFEWWKGSRSLTLFVRSGTELDYLKAWGPDVERDMEDGPIHGLNDFLALSRWLEGV